MITVTERQAERKVKLQSGTVLKLDLEMYWRFDWKMSINTKRARDGPFSVCDINSFFLVSVA